MAIVSQLAESASLSTAPAARVTNKDDESAGDVNKALAVLTRYFPIELVAPYAVLTAALDAPKPSAATIKRFVEKDPPVGAADIPTCNYGYDERLMWFLGFLALVLVLVPLLNYARTTPASGRLVWGVDVPMALLAFALWGLAMEGSPLDGVCGSSVNALQLACALLGAVMVPALANALKKRLAQSQ
jgi:hypothetical protein